MTLPLTPRLRELREQLGAPGLIALALIAGAAAFTHSVLDPALEKNRLLEASIARAQRPAAPQATAGAADKLAELYRFLERAEAPTDWLAKLHGIGAATGVQLQSASYRTQSAGGRVERYEIVLPVSGPYLQVREFLKRALAEIPVLSLDQMTLKRETRNDGALQAELKLTLHTVKP